MCLVSILTVTVRNYFVASVIASALVFSNAAPAFTYQGRLAANGQSAGGNYQVMFGLFDAAAGGAQVGGPLTNSVSVDSNGIFATELDFGPDAFDAGPRWLQLAVRTNAAAAFVFLSPRQTIAPSPFALYAQKAGTAAFASVAAFVQSNPPVAAHAISVTNFTFSESVTLAKAGIADAGVNRFGWPRTLARTADGGQLHISVVGNGWAEDSEVAGFITNLLSYRPLAGYASTLLFVLPTAMRYGPSGASDTALLETGDDTNWHNTYFLLTNSGSISAPVQILTSDVCNVQYLANPNGGSFTLEVRTNGANAFNFTNLDSTWTAVGSGNASNATWLGRVLWWTNATPVPTQLRVRATSAGYTPIVGYAQWNSRVTNGVILSQYSRQNSGNWWTYTDTNRVYPIWSAWNPDMVLLTGGFGDPRLNDAVGTLNLVRRGFPLSDVVDVGSHVASQLRSDVLEKQYCQSNGIPFFDGQGASISAWGGYANGNLLGLYADTAHLTAEGYASFSDLLWSWIGFGNYAPAAQPAGTMGVTTNVTINGMTLYITNGAIGRISVP